MAIDSSPGNHTDIWPVLFESVWSGGVPSGENSIEKWPVAEL